MALSLAHLKLSCLHHTLLAIGHTAEVTMATFEISCLLPPFFASMASFGRVMVVTGIYGPLDEEY